MSSKPWGVILAGGDGTRLKTISRFISGDSRPKQFCVLFGSSSLLARTRGRLSNSIEPHRMLFAVVRNHERFYKPELADVDESRIVVQPSNRGTTAAIIYSLLRLTRLEKDPMAAFFPADHHLIDEQRFKRAVNRAFEVVDKHPELLVVLGARAENAEVEYGWIEPGRPLDDEGKSSSPVFRVNRFWEKPTVATAELLLGRGCLWNTFVIAGRVRTFLEILESAIPHAMKSFYPVAESRTREEETDRVAALYESFPTGDFSREVLTQRPERLAVLRMDDIGWGDLGIPEGVLTALQKTALAAADHPNPAETEQPVVSSSAFSVWLAAYRHRLEEVCQHAGGKTMKAESPR